MHRQAGEKNSAIFFFSRQCSLWWDIFHHIRFFCQILRVLQTKRFLFPSPFFLSYCLSELGTSKIQGNPI